MAVSEDGRQASWWARLLTLAVTIVPFLAFLFALHQLWDHQVNARDLLLLGIFYILTALGVCVGFHRLRRG